jgi:hypothetical protein
MDFLGFDSLNFVSLFKETKNFNFDFKISGVFT